jgi:hypothetical protein
MDTMKPNPAAKRYLVVLILVLGMLASFISGFTLGDRSFETRWLGLMAFGREDPGIDPGIVLQEMLYVTEYDESIVIGLRDDGVVVWKWAIEDSITIR